MLETKNVSYIGCAHPDHAGKFSVADVSFFKDEFQLFDVRVVVINFSFYADRLFFDGVPVVVHFFFDGFLLC